MVCSACGLPVIEGPKGGYVCGQCLHTVEPDGYAEERVEGLQLVAAARKERTQARRAAKAAGHRTATK